MRRFFYFFLLAALATLALSQDPPSSSPPAPPAPAPASDTDKDTPLDFIQSVGNSFVVIFIAEIADKTFIMVIIFSMTMNRCLVYAGATTSMVLMHTIATFLGGVFPLIFNQTVIKWTAVVIFTVFGVYLIVKGCKKKKKRDVQAKFKKVRQELENQGYFETTPVAQTTTTTEMKDKEALEEPLLPVAENQQQRPKKSKSCCRKFVDNAFVKMFVVCFLAEWGDRSQLTAMALAAANDMYGVWLGGSVAHVLCTSIGVGCGTLLVGYISPRTLTIISGIVCLIFAVEFVIFQ